MECKNVINFLNCDIRYAFMLKMRPESRLFQCKSMRRRCRIMICYLKAKRIKVLKVLKFENVSRLDKSQREHCFGVLPPKIIKFYLRYKTSH